MYAGFRGGQIVQRLRVVGRMSPFRLPSQQLPVGDVICYQIYLRLRFIRRIGISLLQDY